MYKSILSAILLSSMLVGCGAGAQSDDKQAVTMQQAQGNEYKFVASFLGQSVNADGYASNQQDAVYDALAWMASNTFKPGTEAYKAMLTEQGLSVLIVASSNGKAYRGVVRLMKDGLHIDVLSV